MLAFCVGLESVIYVDRVKSWISIQEGYIILVLRQSDLWASVLSWIDFIKLLFRGESAVYIAVPFTCHHRFPPPFLSQRVLLHGSCWIGLHLPCSVTTSEIQKTPIWAWQINIRFVWVFRTDMYRFAARGRGVGGGGERHRYEYSSCVGNVVYCISTSQGVNMTLAQKPTVQRVREWNWI